MKEPILDFLSIAAILGGIVLIVDAFKPPSSGGEVLLGGVVSENGQYSTLSRGGGGNPPVERWDGDVEVQGHISRRHTVGQHFSASLRVRECRLDTRPYSLIRCTFRYGLECRSDQCSRVIIRIIEGLQQHISRL